MASHVFNTQKAQQASTAWPTDPIRLALVGTGYVPDPDAASLQAALGANEVNGPGYSRKALTGKTVDREDSEDEAHFLANDVVYLAAAFGTVKGGIVYRELDAEDDALNVPVAYCELEAPVDLQGGTFTFQFGGEGVFKAA